MWRDRAEQVLATAGAFTKEQLTEGVNLAVLPTPMAKQAAQVHDLTLKHNNLHFNRWRQFQVPLQNDKSPGVQEALSSGLPAAVLWDPGYAASIDRDAVAACDSLDDLAGEVLALIANPHRRVELSRRGLEHARKRWSWEATARSYARLYRGALPPRPTLTGIAA